MDAYVERAAIEVLRVQADMNGEGPAGAMRALEAKLASLKGRKFYGAFRILEAGEEYFACVERLPGEDPRAMGLELATIPGGLYLRRKVFDWERVIQAGELPAIGREMVRAYPWDRSRPELEFYRSSRELHLLLPVTDRGGSGPASEP